MNRLATLFFVFIVPFLVTALAPVATGSATTAQAEADTNTLDYALEAERIAFYTNIQRRSNGLAPLKISRELTEAALLFAEDAVVNMESNYCGHTSSDGRTVGDRLRENGMVGMAMWGENVVCGYMTPQDAVDAWMESDGHRANILTPEFTEIGIGHFVDDISGYIVQNFALDESASFVIIDNESPSTPSPDVELYIYDHNVRSGMAGMGPAIEMMISNSPDFAGAAWQPFSTEVTWSLEPGEGQRRVYVVTRDADGRRSVRFDDIYLGASATSELTLNSYPSIKTQISYEVIASQLPEAQGADKVQLSMEWEFCETDQDVQAFFGVVDTVSDADAHGGTALKFTPSDQQAIVSMWSQEYIPGDTMVAYVRLKVESNQSADEVMTINILGDETVYATLPVHANEFVAAQAYQEFPIRFTVPTDFKPAALKVNLHQQNDAVVYADGVTFFTDDIPFTSDFNWRSMRPAYRDRGVRIRTVAADGTASSPYAIYPIALDASSVSDEPAVEPTVAVEITETDPVPADEQEHVTLQTVPGGQVSFTHRVGITCSNCPQPVWSVSSNAQWLSGNRVGSNVEISVNAANLPVGNHEANLVVEPDDTDVAEVTEIVVFVTVVDVGGQREESSTMDAATDVIFIPVTLK